jgi:hypothetical protein
MGANRGVLEVQATFTDFSPKTLRFTQTTPATVDAGGSVAPAAGGLNFFIQATQGVMIRNNTNMPWGGFTLDLRERAGSYLPSTEGSADGEHPSFAHFHDDGLAVDRLMIHNEFNSHSILMVNNRYPNDFVAPNTSWTFRQARIHEIERVNDPTLGTPLIREFDLILRPSPVPEPGGLALMAVGILGMGIAYSWRRRKPATA